MQPTTNEHAHATAATTGDVVGPTDEVDRCRATSVEHQQQQQQRRPFDTTAVAIGGSAAAAAAPPAPPAAVGQLQHQHHHQYQLSAAGAMVLSTHQSSAASTVVAVGGGAGAAMGAGAGRGGAVVDDGSSGYGSPDSETGLESTATTVAAALAVGKIVASSAPPVQWLGRIAVTTLNFFRKGFRGRADGRTNLPT